MDNLKIFNELSRLCSKKVTQLYSTSFSSAISVLHSDLHKPVYSIYGFVRLADEIVDSFHGYDKKSLLDDFKRDTFGAIASGVSINPVLHSFQWVVNTYDIDHHYIHAFFESMYADLDKKVWKDQNELNAYIYGSAEVVGLMCLHIFCEGDQALIKKLTPSAQALGAAFQKVNFMRDLREDTYDLGRRYFHDIQMDQFDKDTKIKIEEQITKDFEEAFNGLMQLPSKSRYGVLLAYRYYLCLFEKIKRLPPENILNKRIRVPDYQKLFLLLRISLGSRLATNLA